jgi:hypothetical protein
MKRKATSYEDFSFEDMERFASEAFGPRGLATVKKWAVFNKRYFGGKLRPVPLVITHAQPFGNRIGFCSYFQGNQYQGRTITLNVPKRHYVLLADNVTLLHEMIHQCLFENGERPEHASEGWRREIMRLHKQITGRHLWAGRSMTQRIGDQVVRINQPADDGTPSLTQGQIARWPHDIGIDLGKLGAR